MRETDRASALSLFRGEGEPQLPAGALRGFGGIVAAGCF